MNWRNFISQQVGQELLPKIETFVQKTKIPSHSAIDQFYKELRTIINIAPKDLDSNSWQGAMSIVAIVSITENYFRNVLGDILRICSISKKNAGEGSMSFGSVLWHPIVERGFFEHISFSDSKKIQEITKKYVGFDCEKGGLQPIMSQFAKICELRHGIVHSGRFLAGKNALQLEYPPTIDLVKISIGYGQLQSVAAVCTTLVVSYNQRIFELLCKRWAIEWRLNVTWDKRLENKLFKQIWDMFFSDVDKTNGSISEAGTWIKCRNLVKKEFNV